MKKKIFFVIMVMMILVGCNSQNKSRNDTSTGGNTEQSQEVVDTLSIEAIDDSGEAIAEDTVPKSVIDTISESGAEKEEE